ncbi:LysR substrate-binding domain-containing protein [Micromonospora sp. NPDC051543]|uniref:LysR substrate-binding domain-containing protein n=1 Tax=Micromonospora sp. NPDC051543 TaxID=3364287 RepID=UPI00378BB258
MTAESSDGPGAPRPVLTSVEEKLEHVAAEAGVVILPLSIARFYTRPDVVHVPVGDLADNQVCLAWAESNRSPLVREFVDIAVRQAGDIGPGDRT